MVGVAAHCQPPAAPRFGARECVAAPPPAISNPPPLQDPVHDEERPRPALGLPPQAFCQRQQARGARPLLSTACTLRAWAGHGRPPKKPPPKPLKTTAFHFSPTVWAPSRRAARPAAAARRAAARQGKRRRPRESKGGGAARRNAWRRRRRPRRAASAAALRPHGLAQSGGATGRPGAARRATGSLCREASTTGEKNRGVALRFGKGRGRALPKGGGRVPRMQWLGRRGTRAGAPTRRGRKRRRPPAPRAAKECKSGRCVRRSVARA